MDKTKLAKNIINVVKNIDDTELAEKMIEVMLEHNKTKPQQTVQVFETNGKRGRPFGSKNKIKRRRKKKSCRLMWSDEEDEILLSDIPMTKKVKKLKPYGRTYVAVKTRLRDYKAGKIAKYGKKISTISKRQKVGFSSAKPWTRTEDAIIKGPGTNETKVRELMKHGRSRSSILTRMWRIKTGFKA